MKILACLRLLGTGRSLDDMDDRAGMGWETPRTYFKRFWTDVLTIYGAVYLKRRTKKEELMCLNNWYTEIGFAGCVGAVDLIKLKWKNCPFTLKGQYHNSHDGHLETVQVEAWAGNDLYGWN